MYTLPFFQIEPGQSVDAQKNIFRMLNEEAALMKDELYHKNRQRIGR
jgi:hypothetical protein